VEKKPVEFHEKLLEEGGTVKFVTYYLFKTSLHYMYTQDIFIKFPTPMAYRGRSWSI
jgi:hypothetical protein